MSFITLQARQAGGGSLTPHIGSLAQSDGKRPIKVLVRISGPFLLFPVECSSYCGISVPLQVWSKYDHSWHIIPDISYPGILIGNLFPILTFEMSKKVIRTVWSEALKWNNWSPPTTSGQNDVMIAFKSWNHPKMGYYIEIDTKIDQIIKVSG